MPRKYQSDRGNRSDDPVVAEGRKELREQLSALRRQQTDFMARVVASRASEEEVDLLRKDYGEEVPEDVLEQIARQQAMAYPILEQYHLIHENTPSLVMARATSSSRIDEIMDIMAAIDLTALGDAGDFPDEYTCPRCAHRWSGAPNHLTGYGDKVYIPTGRVSTRTGRLSFKRFGPTHQTQAGFKYGRYWRGAKAENLPRGFGNKPIGQPIVGETWRKKPKHGSTD